jgi:hypothetical protein
MISNLQSRLDHCYELAENGDTKSAEVILLEVVEKFCSKPLIPSKDAETVLKSIEKASHRIGVDVAFGYAEYFYQNGDPKAARGWLLYANDHAKYLGMNIGHRISEMKGRYKDRMPLFF